MTSAGFGQTIIVDPPTPPPVSVVPTPGPPGPPGGVTSLNGDTGDVILPQPATFIGTWSSFSTAHTFPYLPPVLVVDAGGLPVEADVEYPDTTHVAITFPAPFTGSITI